MVRATAPGLAALAGLLTGLSSEMGAADIDSYAYYTPPAGNTDIIYTAGTFGIIDTIPIIVTSSSSFDACPEACDKVDGCIGIAIGFSEHSPLEFLLCKKTT
jgi:hypothetical protein